MAKTRRQSYLSPKKLLPTKEYAKYRETQEILARRSLRERIKNMQEEREYRRKKAKYEGTAGGKISKGIAGAFKMFGQRGGVARTLYRRDGQLPPLGMRVAKKTVQGKVGVGRGRPVGTLDQRYAQYGGVYGYRKAMAMQRWKQKQEILERSVTNPRQREIFNQIRARDEARMQSPERRTIPDTSGGIPLRNIFDEINSACNLVD